MIVARPLTIAEIFDRTVTLAVQRWRPVVILSLLGSIPSVLARAAAHGQLLGAAVLVAVLTPAIAVDAGLKQLATVLGGLWWLTLPGTLLASLIGTGFGMGLSTIAAIDYRLRAEGTDLHAALEMPAPA
jgi:hypothetical protein